MIETIFSALIVASISGAAFVAYNHPSKFRRISNSFSGTLIIIFLLLLAWNMGYDDGIKAFKDLDSTNTKVIQAIAEKTKPHDQTLGWAFFIVIGVIVYLQFLDSFVAKLKCVPDDENQENEGNGRIKKLAEAMIEKDKEKRRLKSIRMQAMQAEIDRMEFEARRAESAGDNDRLALLRSELSSKITDLNETKNSDL
jgi:hypothetical protein